MPSTALSRAVGTKISGAAKFLRVALCAVYSIAKDEEKFVERWAASAAQADLILLADTGSTDRTVEIARSVGVEVISVHVVPWRFDIARSAALAAVPADIDWCIALDLDEVLLPGWREALDGLDPSVTRPSYPYTWSWNPDGSFGLRYLGDKVHSRAGFRWTGPVHETLEPYGSQTIVRTFLPGFEIHHFPDPTKSRGHYLDLLAMAAKESPTDTRRSFWYARDLLFAGRHEEAMAEFDRFLSLPGGWSVERSRAIRYIAAMDPPRRTELLEWATREAPERREVWVDLAKHRSTMQDWAGSLAAAQTALSISWRPDDYLFEAEAWRWQPDALAFVALANLERRDEAIAHAEIAVRLGAPEWVALDLMHLQQEV